MKTLTLLTVVLTFAVLGFKCGNDRNGNPKPSENDGVFRGSFYDTVKLVTPKGVVIGDRRRINPALAAEVDKGLDKLFEIARAEPNNYKFEWPSYKDFRVWLFPRSPLCENPSFLVDATGSPYEGSEYDKDPSPNRCLICAAGMTIFQGLQGTAPGMLVADDLNQMSTIVRYEGEHNLLRFIDFPRYGQTQYHPPPHAILGEGPPSALAEKHGNFTAVTMTLPQDVKTGAGLLEAGTKFCVLLTK